MTTGIFYLNTYRPLVWTLHGRKACETLAIAPFVDASIRREPDFEHEHPPITCVCRSGKFAPRLKVGDVVAYMTKRGCWGDFRDAHWRLTCVLEVIAQRPSHDEAAVWYRERGLLLPGNILVDGNPPLPIAASARDNREYRHLDDAEMQRAWDRVYQIRTRRHGAVAICRRAHLDLSWHADAVTEEDLIAHFGKVPSTRNPGGQEMDRGLAFLRRFQIHVGPACP